MEKFFFLIISLHLISLTYGQTLKIAGIRFANASMAGTSNTGIIEILKSDTNEWGTICSTGYLLPTKQFGSIEAKVICAMLGFLNFDASLPLKGSDRTQSTAKIMLSQLDCSKFDPNKSLNIDAQCTYAGWGANLGAGCSDHANDVAVFCGPDTAPYTTTAVPTTTVAPNLQTLPSINCNNSLNLFRLQPGPTSGRVEYFDNKTNNWGTICAGSKTSFGQNEAQMICNVMCKQSAFATPLPPSAVLAPSAGTVIAIDNLRCPVNATNLNQCSSDTGSNVAAVCTATTMSVGVQCGYQVVTPAPPPSIQVVCQSYRATVYFVQTGALSPSLISLQNNYNPSKCDFKVSGNATYVMADFPIMGCNETMSSNTTHITYTVYLRQDVSLNNANVSVNSVYIIPIVCALPKVNQVTGNPINPGLLTLPPIIGNQRFFVTLDLYGGRDQNGNFIEALKMPANVAVGKQINVVLNLVGGGSAVRLVVLQCSATKSATSSNPTLPLIVNKCGAQYCDQSVPRTDPTYCTKPGDYRIIATPLTDQSFFFYFPAFQWTPGDTSSQLFISCQVYACDSQSTDASCSSTCGTLMPTVNKRKRRSADFLLYPKTNQRRRRSAVQSQVNQLSNGPIIVKGQGFDVQNIINNNFIKRSTLTTASFGACLFSISFVLLHVRYNH